MPTPPPNLPVNEPLTGYVGEVGGRAGESQGIFRTSEKLVTADMVLSTLAAGSAVIVVLMLLILLVVLFQSSIPAIRTFGLSFFTQTEWRPNELQRHDSKGNLIVKSKEHDPDTDSDIITYETDPPTYHALAPIYGTVISAVLALTIAVPLSMGAALFLVRIGAWLSPTFVKCGVAGLLLTLFLGALGAHSSLWLIVGAVVGMVATGAAMYIAWSMEDPRVGPRPVLEYGIIIAVALVVLLFGRLIADGSWVGSGIAAVLAAGFVHYSASSFVGIVSFLIEFLAAIPSIAYGIWGTLVLIPFLSNHVEPSLNSFFGSVPFLGFLHVDISNGHNLLAAAIILSIMVLPIITAISRDVLKAVPRIQIEGTQALGATWWQSSWEMLRYGRSGLLGAIILGLARASGETMAVLMVMPPDTRIATSILKPVATMAALIASQFPESNDAMHRAALTEIALVLLVMSLAFNVVARYLVVGGKRTAA